MTECVATCKSEGRTQTSCTLSASPVYFSVQVLCISRCWSCVFLCAALCVHIFLLRVETALRRLAHSMSGLRGYYRTNIETPSPPSLLISSVFLFSKTSGSGDDDEEINGTIHNCRHAIRAKYSYICHHLPPPIPPQHHTGYVTTLVSKAPFYSSASDACQCVLIEIASSGYCAVQQSHEGYVTAPILYWSGCCQPTTCSK